MHDPLVMNDDTSHLVTKMLELTQARQGVISHNLANANTPGFIRQELEFKTQLAQALRDGDINRLGNEQGSIVDDMTRPVRKDGNNVSVPSEMNEMMQNGVLYNLLAKAFSTKLNIMKAAIKGG